MTNPLQIAFTGGGAPSYVEDVFSTTLYTGTGATLGVNTGIGLVNGATNTGWIATLSGTGNDNANGITTDISGNVYICGNTDSQGAGGADFLIAKYSSSGVIQWQRILGSANTEVAYSIKTDSLENIYIVGISGANGDASIAKYNSSGTIQWQRTLSTSSADYFFDLFIDNSDNIYCCGRTSGQGGALENILIAKYNSSGTIQWQRTLSGSSSDEARGIVANNSGDVYICGSTSSGGFGNSDALITKYNSSGAIQWQKIFGGSSTDIFYYIALDSSNNIYCVGTSYTTINTENAIIVKYDSSGTVLWQRILSGTSVDQGYGICVDNNNNIYITGQTNIRNSADTDAYIVKYNSSGTIQWQRTFGSQSSEYGQNISVDTSGNIYICGPTGTDAFFAKLPSDGSGVGVYGNFIYESSNLIDSAGGFSSGTSSLVDAASTLTAATSTYTSSTSTLTSTTIPVSIQNSNGGLVWIKGRSGATDHALYDTNRGATFDLASNSTAAQTTQTTGVTNFLSNGITIGTLAKLNTNSATYAAWTFKKAPKFFDVVTITKSSAGAQTFSHNLGSVPGCMIVKQTSGTQGWLTYHRSLNAGVTPANYYLSLQATTAETLNTNVWDGVAPTSTEFTLGSSVNTGSFVVYLFAYNAGGFGLSNVDNIISCNSAVTNASGAATVNLGYEPQWLLIKRRDFAGDWYILDNMRAWAFSSARYIVPNTAAAEASTTYWRINSQGFNLIGWNASATYVYVAIRRGPMEIPTLGTDIYNAIARTGTGAAATLTNAGFPPDAVFAFDRNSATATARQVQDKLRGAGLYTLTSDTSIEVSSSQSITSFDQNGISFGTSPPNQSAVSYINYLFRRAPNFFDEVCYIGNGVADTAITHNLAAIPGMVIIKNRAVINGWVVYTNAIDGTMNVLYLNDTLARTNTGRPQYTSSIFYVSSGADTNGSANNMVAWLFGNCPGVSKVSTYLGTGTTQQVNCGFSSGARFVLIKRVDSTSAWYLWDSTRGIVSGNDPYLLVNTTGAEVTNTDYVDPYSAGFEISSTAIAALNEAPGITWVSRTSGFSTTAIRDVAYGNGLWVAVGNSGTMTTSADSIGWTSRTSGFGGLTIFGIEYGNGLWVAVGGAANLRTSTDGITWTTQVSNFGVNNINAISYGNGLWVAGGASGTLATSSDGITWTLRTSQFGAAAIQSIAYGNGIFVAVGVTGAISTSTDGITWISRTSGVTTVLNGISFGNGLFVIAGSSGVILTSADGITWTSRTNGFGTSTVYSTAYTNGIYVAVGDSALMQTSTNGITWTTRTSGFGSIVIYNIAVGNNMFIAVGGNGTMTINKPQYLYLAIA